VDACFNSSFDHNGAVPYKSDGNTIMEENYKQWHELGIHLVPMLTINGEIFEGQLNPDNVFEAICAGYIDMPKGCKKWLEKEGIEIPDDQKGVESSTLFLIVGVLVLANFFLVLVYRNYLQKEIKNDMKIQVSSAVSQYVALSQIKELETDKTLDSIE